MDEYRQLVETIKELVDEVQHPNGKHDAMEKFMREMVNLWLYEIDNPKTEDVSVSE